MKRHLYSAFILSICIFAWYAIVIVGIAVPLPTETANFEDITHEHRWANPAINYMVENGIMSGMTDTLFMPDMKVTREQLAKLIVTACDLTMPNQDNMQIYTDVTEEMWSRTYIRVADEYIHTTGAFFEPQEPTTREVTAVALVRGLGLTNTTIDADVLSVFNDHEEINPELRNDFTVAFLKGYIQGQEGEIMPQGAVTRAEIAVILYRALTGDPDSSTIMDYQTGVKIVGDPLISLERAIRWAEENGADKRFIDVAPLYWEYGKKTGIRADVLYVQAAKETAFGNYTGSVRADMNNWAGIKRRDGVGDETEAHETFATPEDGVRAQFNHMGAYVGIDPIGTPHERHAVVMSTNWAGTICYVEELGTRWAPADDYGISIVGMMDRIR